MPIPGDRWCDCLRRKLLKSVPDRAGPVETAMRVAIMLAAYGGPRADLRHTAVALWIAAGASPKEIAVGAGHTSVATVLDRYGHLLPGHEDTVNDALDEMAATH